MQAALTQEFKEKRKAFEVQNIQEIPDKNSSGASQTSQFITQRTSAIASANQRRRSRNEEENNSNSSMSQNSTPKGAKPPPALPERPSEATISQFLGRNRSLSVPDRTSSLSPSNSFERSQEGQENSNRNSSKSPTRVPRPSPSTVVGMNPNPSEGGSRRKTNYNSIRPLPRDRNSNENSPEVKNNVEVTKLIEEYKRRELEMKNKIKLVLASVNEERLSLHKMVKHYKRRLEQEEMRSKGMESQLKMKEELITSLQSQVRDLQSNVMSEINRPRSEEIELQNKLATVEAQLQLSNDKNKDLSHRILFLEARLEKDLLENSRKMEQEFTRKIATMDKEIASRVKVQLQKEFQEREKKSSQNSSQNSYKKGEEDDYEVDYVRTSSSLTSSVSSISSLNSSQKESTKPPTPAEQKSSASKSGRPNLPPKTGGALIAAAESKLQTLSTEKPKEESKTRKEEPKIIEMKSSSEQSGVKKPKPSILALYDYASGAPDDLEFQEGDLLILHKRYSDGWWLAELDGKMGRVPSNFMQDLTTVTPVKMVARGTFEAECQGDLKFKKGQTIFILNQEDDWWIGQLEDGSIGYLPRNYVKVAE